MFAGSLTKYDNIVIMKPDIAFRKSMPGSPRPGVSNRLETDGTKNKRFKLIK